MTGTGFQEPAVRKWHRWWGHGGKWISWGCYHTNLETKPEIVSIRRRIFEKCCLGRQAGGDWDWRGQRLGIGQVAGRMVGRNDAVEELRWLKWRYKRLYLNRVQVEDVCSTMIVRGCQPLTVCTDRDAGDVPQERCIIMIIVTTLIIGICVHHLHIPIRP